MLHALTGWRMPNSYGTDPQLCRCRDFSFMKIFVTGGAGYVGSHCCKAFAAAGWEVVVYDNLSRGWRDFVRWGPLIEGDILDQQKLGEALRATQPDAVAHFAAFAYVGESVEQPNIYYRNNFVGAMNLVDSMLDAGVRRLIFSSTCATYGIPPTLPVVESSPQSPVNPYGWSKLMTEKLLADYARAYDFRYVALRYFNAAGADPDGEVGERHVPETHAIPLGLLGADDGDYAFKIMGTDYDTADGTAVRDYIHVSDLAQAHRQAVDYLSADKPSVVINLGTGRGVSVAELAAAIERVTGRTIKCERVGRRPGDPPVLVAEPGLARQLLGWRPQHSDIDTIVSTAYRWHRKERPAR